MTADAKGEPTAAYIEIVEKNRTTDDTSGGSTIVPNVVRINGIPLLCPEGEQIKVHGMTFNDGLGEDVAQVTLTLFARRVVIAAEGDLPATATPPRTLQLRVPATSDAAFVEIERRARAEADRLGAHGALRYLGEISGDDLENCAEGTVIHAFEATESPRRAEGDL